MALARIGQSAPMRVIYAEPAGRGLYRPSFAGSRCLQVAVMEAAEVSPFAADSPDTVEINRVANLIAIPLAKPERYRLRKAGAFALGLPLVWSGRPVDVVETPLEWLRAGGNALCILDWTPSWRFRMLMDASELRPTTEFLRIQLRSALTRDGLPIAKD
ncbi:hypothetical protein [Qipengyuania gaetbuli]|uniref:hypothetical protein n=1 Tax=Qipengyuania gaetbuli TaxID=266952 RepID=UPI001CFEF15A|nr:hypothetical protein [Qipengyuania gaetbuli]